MRLPNSFRAEVNAQDALAYLVYLGDEMHKETGDTAHCVRHRWAGRQRHQL